MKNFVKFILFCLISAALICIGCYCTHAQIQTAPLYTGTLNQNVFIPAVYGGKMYKISGANFNTSGSTDTISDDPATVTLFSGSGLVQASGSNNGYGYVKYINNTGATHGAGTEIYIAFNQTVPHVPVPVIAYVETSVSYSLVVIYSITTSGFKVRLKDDIADGDSIAFTYLVKFF